MAMDTPDNVDLHIAWSAHVDWLEVSINHNALYVVENHPNYDPEREQLIYQRRIKARWEENPVVALMEMIGECQQVPDTIKQKEAQEVA